MKPNAKYIIWPRIDQKTCLKCIITANLIPVVIEPILEKDELITDHEMIEKRIKELGPENVLAVFTTTSCFAPRTPDNLEEVAKISKETGVFHVVNNAYGL